MLHKHFHQSLPASNVYFPVTETFPVLFKVGLFVTEWRDTNVLVDTVQGYGLHKLPQF